MTHYHSLSSEKYYREVVLQEIKDIRRQANREAVSAFAQFVFVLGVFSATVYVFQTMSQWLPVVTGYFDGYGITEAFQNWLG